MSSLTSFCFELFHLQTHLSWSCKSHSKLNCHISLQEIFHLLLSAHHSRPAVVMGMCVMMETSPPCLLGLPAFTLYLIMSHTGGKLYLPPSPLRLGFRAHPDSVVKISLFSNSTECSGRSRWMCFETSEVVELGLQCSLNLTGTFPFHLRTLPHILHTWSYIQVLPCSLCSPGPWVSPTIVVAY